MCSSSYGTGSEDFEVYRPSPEVIEALGSTLEVVSSNPDNTTPIGHKFLGVQHYLSGGWFNDDETGNVIEYKSHWLRRGRIATSLLNPGSKPTSVRTVSVAHIEPVEFDDERFMPGPYRLFFLNVPDVIIDTCQYDSYAADHEVVAATGESEIMREHRVSARLSGDDVVTPELETQLIDSLSRGNRVGWLPLHTMIDDWV